MLRISVFWMLLHFTIYLESSFISLHISTKLEDLYKEEPKTKELSQKDL